MAEEDGNGVDMFAQKNQFEAFPHEQKSFNPIDDLKLDKVPEVDETVLDNFGVADVDQNFNIRGERGFVDPNPKPTKTEPFSIGKNHPIRTIDKAVGHIIPVLKPGLIERVKNRFSKKSESITQIPNTTQDLPRFVDQKIADQWAKEAEQDYNSGDSDFDRNKINPPSFLPDENELSEETDNLPEDIQRDMVTETNDLHEPQSQDVFIQETYSQMPKDKVKELNAQLDTLINNPINIEETLPKKAANELNRLNDILQYRKANKLENVSSDVAKLFPKSHWLEVSVNNIPFRVGIYEAKGLNTQERKRIDFKNYPYPGDTELAVIVGQNKSKIGTQEDRFEYVITEHGWFERKRVNGQTTYEPMEHTLADGTIVSKRKDYLLGILRGTPAQQATIQGKVA